MRAFPTRQDPRDWITQYWNILLGTKVEANRDAWLMGPIGAIEEDANQFIERIAEERGLRIESNLPGSGLVDRVDDWGIPVSPAIADFYNRTTNYRLSVRTSWAPLFGRFGYLVAQLFSRRIQQLNLPREDDKTVAFKTEITKLTDSDGSAKYTIWNRSLKETGEVVFFGIYTSCRIPSGEYCVKASFPLPRGCATVIFRPERDMEGNLLLVSSGKKCGDPGFYFLVEDGRGCLWKHYLPAVRESILISESADGSLKAEHTMKLWWLKVFSMIYRITQEQKVASDERE